MYVHRLSNHPPALLKNIPQNINKRLTNISSTEQVFTEATAPYQQALEESGYDHKLKFDPQARRATKKSKARKRKITWYNPPWDNNVKTNLGFPKDHPLRKIFNRHTLKLSYSCMPNMKAVISSHNKNMLAQYGATAASSQQPRTRNCRNKPECPLQGNCMQENVVYQATVATETTMESYAGLASNFKERYRNHQTSFRHSNKRNETELSKYIWDLKDQKKSFRVKWRVLKTCHPYNSERSAICAFKKSISSFLEKI